jgi:hypothetical protein
MPQPTIVIRGEQMRQFQRSSETRLVMDIAEYLRRELPAAVSRIPDGVLQARIRTGVRKARCAGYERGSSISVFVGCMFLGGPAFDEYPPIQHQLSQTQYDPEERLRRLFATVTDSQWQGARKRSAPGAWENASRVYGA